MPEHNRNTTRMRLKDDEAQLIREYRGFQTEAIEMDIDPHDINHGWMKSKIGSFHFTNPDYETPKFDPDKIDWQHILKDIKPKQIECTSSGTAHFDRLVLTDAHIGMTTNKDGYSLYGGKWGEKELLERMNDTMLFIYERQQSDTLYLDDLGDLMDGWNGETVRKGHGLPQNMDNQEAFDVAVRFKRLLVEGLLKAYEKVIVHNICKDNHSGDFGAIVNNAFKMLMEEMHPGRVEVINQRKFIDHYSVGNNTFILSHGKDDLNLKFGFPVHLEGSAGARARQKIDEYIDTNFLLKKGVHIEFSKGDSHQSLFDKCSSERFYYMNYPSFSPSSNWVQTNYKKGRSGVVFCNYWDKKKPQDITTHELMFKWEK